MAREKQFRGWMTALVTPFKDGAVDEAAYRSLIDWQIESGIAGLVPVGTTGESPTLSHEEHKKVVEIAVSEARGRVPVIAGAGSNNTSEAVELAIHAEKAGASAALVVTPYYNKPNQEGLFQHFRAIDEAVGIPIVIYNIPPRSVIDMSVETMKRCYGELRHIVGVKDATGNIGRISLQRQALGPEFLQFSGDDLTALATFAAGAVGCISVVSNIAPRPCADLWEAASAGDYAKALAIQDKLTPLHVATFLEAGVTGAKTGLNLLGRVGEDVRLPLVGSTAKTRAAIEAAMAFAGVLNG
ncbi:4-hydroxy-tetrahydrodipicolinate synthase [uncultured Rhodoblastus sp.]|uniref:4-hydroxy-tetrahydrodipicolinate synthase n=1 Tax=uncultured Rhodoblastus sp. TaxID=543037 RepID=UPI0025E17885|nr:4-hydroxy-tetrahydrodipicolinate synthase [uncultured Rhodoblastus sp.]